MRPTSHLPRQSSNKGAALIIVLAFVVLLTGLVLTYFSHATTDRQLAHTSFHDTDAEMLARSALDTVVGDLRQEITSGPTITAANIIPQRSSQIAAGVPNLIRRSVRSDLFTGNPAQPSRASAVNSQDNPSADGRSISSTRWNGHYLVPKGNVSTPDCSPVPAFSDATPDWVFVKAYDPATQKAGPAVITVPDALVVGRYAYAVYDEGGLLDINVAGYPTSTGGSPTVTDIGRKSVLAFADLAALPTTLSPAAINNFILFRNYATMGSIGTFGTDITSAQASAFVNYYLGNPQTGTSQDFGQVNRFSSNASGSLRTDQSFVTRAELINFVKSPDIVPTANVNTLQYLGTFSSERNHSTWSNSLTLLANRFSLSRFELFASTPPTAADAATIQQRFGLVYVPASPPTPEHWRYVGTSGSALLAAIPTVTGANQDPDLFPLLKYALPATATIGEILSIGASLIDQRDSDAHTTWIEYGDPLSPSKAFGVDSIPDPSAPPLPSNLVLLKRAFRNVGELGYAYRNSSSTLDFHTAGSTDAPLLDLFTYNTAAPAPGRSGIVSLNTRQAPVLAAILMGAIYNNSSSSVVSLSDATTAANSIVNETATTHAVGRADIARLASVMPSLTFTSDEEGQETISRALSEVVQTRTWGLLIDLVAQTGHYKPNAQSLQNDFVVEGEKHCWLHIAIDRFDGTIVGQQLEEVTE